MIYVHFLVSFLKILLDFFSVIHSQLDLIEVETWDEAKKNVNLILYLI